MKYVRCDSHCKYPAYDKEEVDNLLNDKTDKTDVYTKEEVDNKFNAEHKIYSGTSEPDTELGKEGDVYFQYEE